jgi:hypothetical protein
MGPSDDVLLATVSDFADRSGAARVVVLLDRGPDHLPPTLEAEPGEPVTIELGDQQYLVPRADLMGVEPLPLDLPAPVPATALDIDAERGEVEAPIGVLAAMGDAVTRLAAAMGGRSVAQAEWVTRSHTTLSLAARVGEPVVVTAGEHQFELPR